MLRKIITLIVTALIIIFGIAYALSPLRTLQEQLDEAVGPIVEAEEIAEVRSEEVVATELFSEMETEVMTVSYFEEETENVPLQIVSGIVREETESETEYVWYGPILNAVIGTVEGPSGKETYYNLDMSYVVEIMKNCGYDYEFWVREDGVKMYGDYIMCAADLNIRPRGTILQTSLGEAMVCDTGTFAESNPTQLDIAVTW